jgi:hypothetical protein
MFIETYIYDNPHQTGLPTKNELININNIIRITPVTDVYGYNCDEVYIYLIGCPTTPYIRSCESYETIVSKIRKAGKTIE